MTSVSRNKTALVPTLVIIHQDSLKILNTKTVSEEAAFFPRMSLSQEILETLRLSRRN